MSGWLGHRLVRLARVTSTSDEAARLAEGGAAHGTVVVADEQTAGRGRQGRRWHSPAGANLYLSMVLRPSLSPGEVAPITLAAGIGVCDAVNSAGVAASLKWPNDLLVRGRKLAGILSEMNTRNRTVDHVIVGIGIDVNQTAFPPELAAIATSMAAELGRPVDREAFLGVLLEDLERWLDVFFAGGGEAIAGAWTARARLAGRRVRATTAAGPIEGRPDGVDAAGALIVIDDQGGRHRVVSGEVVVAGDEEW
jgi:BirA family biotin operon repressor/biotin-[acetyl-CoA-carboxylase] ligase